MLNSYFAFCLIKKQIRSVLQLQALGLSMDGFVTILKNKHTAGGSNMNFITLDALTVDNVFDQLESFGDQVGDLYKDMAMNIFLSRKWFAAYHKKRHDLHGTDTNYDGMTTMLEGTNITLDIAQKIMASCQNNLCEFWKLRISDLQKVKGIGRQRACQIASMFEISRRRNAAEVVVKPKISRSQDAYIVFHSLIGELPYEEFWMLLLNRANKIMKTVKVSEGGISGTVVDPKNIFCIALENHTTSIILGHCHPSVQCTPSETDMKIIKKLKDNGALLEISILDYIIVAHDVYYSFADEGCM
jgi:DNA repair protein RadC